MKIIAFFLPQFHRTPENDKWWGEGFTEWTNVKRAAPVFKGQKQPKIPLNDYYYDLTDRSTVEWQTRLMHKYGVYGFCYFHYWFNGRKILYKPAENLLKWKDINQKFCFAWANCSWARTWTAAKRFTTNWVEDDKKEDQKSSGILIEQTYGSEKDWEKHYEYLRDFFKDDRYIKKDNKPVFLIYIISDIPCLDEMLTLWNRMAKDDGFDGIHIVSINRYSDNPKIEATAKYGLYANRPGILRRVFNKLLYIIKADYQLPNVFDYESVWKGIIEEEYPKGKTVYPNGVVKYDETPRKGRNATYLKNASPELFEKYLRLQISTRNAEYLFLDAWNEWGEGNYLEPDVDDGYRYLDALGKVADETNSRYDQ